MSIQIQEAQWTSSVINTGRPKLRSIITKLSKVKDREHLEQQGKGWQRVDQIFREKNPTIVGSLERSKLSNLRLAKKDSNTYI